MPSNKSSSLAFVDLRAIRGFRLFEGAGSQPDSFFGAPA
jgi:hypothetical protein